MNSDETVHPECATSMVIFHLFTLTDRYVHVGLIDFLCEIAIETKNEK